MSASKSFSLNFWNSVSSIYGGHNLTTHSSDHELDFVKECANRLISSNNLILSTLICLGVADGSRDPIVILSNLRTNNLPLPKQLYLNDLSPDLLGVCEKSMKEMFSELQATYFAVPMSDVDPNVIPKTETTTALIGLYNADYIMPSLKGYLESKDVIGTKFEIGVTIFENGNIVKHDNVIRFDIESYASFETQITDLRAIPNFLAYSIKTDKDFISHYWDSDNLWHVMAQAFKNKTVKTFKLGERYVMSKIDNFPSDNDDKRTTLITSLNNVIGNIPFEHQMASFEMIDSLF